MRVSSECSSTVGPWRDGGSCEDEEDGASDGRLTLLGLRLYFIVPEEPESLYPAGGGQSES